MSPDRSAKPRPHALLPAALLLAAGCSAGGGGAAEDSDILRIGMAFPPTAGMSPFSDDAIRITRTGAGETLVALDSDGEPAPVLAESWEEADDTTLTLTLRDDVTFHDGTALTAEHAAEALEYATQASPEPRALSGVELEAAAVDERTLELTTAEPDPILLHRLSSPELVILAPLAYEDDPASPDPVGAGTGPYALDEVDGSSTAALSANPDYWGGEPAAEGVEVRFIQEAASRTGALRAGEVDVIDTVPVAQLESITDAEIVDIELPRTAHLHLNTDSGVFADAGMRAAAREAVDIDAIAEGVYEGQVLAAEGIFGPASPWVADRPEREFAEAGDVDGEAITLATYDDRPELPEIASAIAEDLRAAGFEVDVEVQEYSTLETDLLAGEFDAVIGTRSYALDTADPVTYLASDWTCDGGYNLSHLCDADIDAVIGDAVAETDVEERNAAALDIEAQILQLDAVVPLVHERARLGVAPGVTGLAEDPLERELVTVDTAIDR